MLQYVFDYIRCSLSYIYDDTDDLKGLNHITTKPIIHTYTCTQKYASYTLNTKNEK